VGDGLQIATTESLVRRPFDPGVALLLVPRAWLPGPAHGSDGRPAFDPAALPGRAAHRADAVAMLRALYPLEHRMLGLLGAADARVGDAVAESLDSHAYLVPALAGEQNSASPHALPWLVARLRAPDGCPWDREQTHLSLRKYLLEEAYEVHDALEAGSTPDLAGELGDLLLQVVLHAHYSSEAGVFDLTDVYRAVVTKIVRRHPHVFADTEARSVAQVIANWERIKAEERDARKRPPHDERDGMARDDVDVQGQQGAARTERELLEAAGPADRAMPDAFRGLSRSLPALAYSQEIQERAASLGYDWPAIEPVLAKLEEELAEFHAAASDERRAEELGDVLLVVVNLGRKLGIDVEAALRAANARFARRFAAVERLAAAQRRNLNEMSFAELDELWDLAKVETATAPAPRARRETS
jgi:uncharacterized protein YabN with tetrapyrrole methylase and pyrophosphatase domain